MHLTKKVTTIFLMGSAVAILTVFLLPRGLGTPKEEIERRGGTIELLLSGEVDVSLDSPRIGDADMQSVAALCGNHREYRAIRALDVSNSMVTDQGLEKLTELPKLELLYLRHTKVTAAGVSRFQGQMPGCRVLWK